MPVKSKHAILCEALKTRYLGQITVPGIGILAAVVHRRIRPGDYNSVLEVIAPDVIVLDNPRVAEPFELLRCMHRGEINVSERLRTPCVLAPLYNPKGECVSFYRLGPGKSYRISKYPQHVPLHARFGSHRSEFLQTSGKIEIAPLVSFLCMQHIQGVDIEVQRVGEADILGDLEKEYEDLMDRIGYKDTTFSSR